MILTTGQRYLGLAFWFVLCYTASFIGAIASINAKSFYAQLIQPVWAPPGWVFGPVWTVLYTMMAIAAWLFWCNGGFRRNKTALSFFLMQLILNALWSWLFFYQQSGALAFAEIIVLWIFITRTLWGFWKTRKAAGALLIPYLAWVSFAAWLNFALWQLNPQILT